MAEKEPLEKNRFTEEEYKKKLKNNSYKCLKMIQKKNKKKLRRN